MKLMSYRSCIIILILAVLPQVGYAQETDDRDNFGTWTDLIIRKDINNWHIGGYIEYCTIDRFNDEGIKSDELIVSPIVGYNILDWLRVQFQIDFQYCFNQGMYLRYMPEVTFHWKASDFRFSFRTRLQLAQQIRNGALSPIMRNRFKVEYIIPKTPVSLHVAAEPYWLKNLTKARYYAGAAFQVHKNLSITTEYIRYEYYTPSKDQNVFSMVLYVRL